MEFEANLKLVESESYTSNAWASKAKVEEIEQRFGSYIFIRCNTSRDVYVFRLEHRYIMDNEMPDPSIAIDHWPAPEAKKCSVNGSMVSIGGVSPITNIRVIQYLELMYLGPGPTSSRPKVPIDYIKSLLHHRVFPGEEGSIVIKEQGFGYGKWAFTAHYQKIAQTNGSIWAGITDTNTLISIHSLPTSYLCLPKYVTSAKRSISDCIRKAGQPFMNLVTMALKASSYTGDLKAAHSILLQGAAGMGKTTLVRLAAKHLGAKLLSLDGVSSLAAPSQAIFHAALRLQPAIILLDDIELIFPASGGQHIYKVLQELSLFVKHLDSVDNCRVALVGTVSNISALRVKVRSLFDEEVSLQPHDRQWTLDLLSDLELPEDSRNSFVARFGQNISSIVSNVRRISLSSAEQGTANLTHEPHSASSSSSNLVAPRVAWSDIGGCKSIKQKLIETVVWPIERPQMFQRMGICPPSGMILYGPPGTGKTMLAKAAATANGCSLLSVSASDLIRAEFGESEKEISRIFDTARASQPCMIFIDEFQSLFGKRSSAGMTTSRMTSQLLIELDSISTIQPPSSTESADFNRVFVLAATNALDAIDSAFLQPGRFGNVLYVGLPEKEAREDILSIQKSRMPWDSDVDINRLVAATRGFSAASIVALCRRAAMEAMRRLDSNSIESERIHMKDFGLAVRNEIGKME